ncbi:MAG: hypothetical protein ACLT3Y_06835 [Ruminococcus callidus]
MALESDVHPMTEYHHLNNLLWVWNGQSSSFLVDSSQYDIASLDLYVEGGDLRQPL